MTTKIEQCVKLGPVLCRLRSRVLNGESAELTVPRWRTKNDTIWVADGQSVTNTVYFDSDLDPDHPEWADRQVLRSDYKYVIDTLNEFYWIIISRE